MAYLCVNKNGEELICQNEPERWGDIRKETSSPFGSLDRSTGKRYETTPAKSWEIRSLKFEDLSYWRDMEILNMGEFYISYATHLPKGSIEKLIGKTLTWEDEPVEIL